MAVAGLQHGGGSAAAWWQQQQRWQQRNSVAAVVAAVAALQQLGGGISLALVATQWRQRLPHDIKTDITGGGGVGSGNYN